MASLDKVLLHAESHDAFLKQFMGGLAAATRVSNTLSKGLNFDYNKSYAQFREEQSQASSANHELLERLLNICTDSDAPSSSARLPADVSDPAVYDLIVDAVDSLLDRADRNLNAGLPTGATDAVRMGLRHDKDRAIMEVLEGRKPQDSFLESINNERQKPFQPHLPNKYCYLVPYDGKPLPGPAPDQMIDEPSDIDLGEPIQPAEYYPHPYEREIQQASVPDILPGDAPSVPDLVGRPYFFVDTPASFAKMLTYLQRAKEIAVDLEHHSLRSFQGLTCLMQISTREADFVVDALKLRSVLPQLGKYFANPNVIKILHGSTHDLMWLQRDFSLYIVTLFDTFDAATTLGMHTRSFAHLVHHYCGVKLDKTYQLADWRRRPLPKEMEDYARGDTHYLLCVYDHLRQDILRTRGAVGLEECLLASRKRCLQRYEKPLFRPCGYRILLRGNKQGLSEQQEQVLARLWDWRDDLARTQDESPVYLMANAEMLRIAMAMADTAQKILQCGPLSTLAREHPEQVADVVRQALQATDLLPVKITAMPSLPKTLPSTLPVAPSNISAPTVFTFCPLTIASPKPVAEAATLTRPASPPLLDTKELFLSSGWKSPLPAEMDEDQGWSPLIMSALKPVSMSEENRQRVARVLETLKAQLDPSLASHAANSQSASAPLHLSSSASEGVRTASGEEPLPPASSPASQGLSNDIPQSFEEIYKLSGQTRKKNKQKKALAGSTEGPLPVVPASGPAFDFQTYFAGDANLTADAGLDGTLSIVQKVGWANEEDAQAIREECSQAQEEVVSSAASVHSATTGNASMRRSYEKHSNGHPGVQRLYASHDRIPLSGRPMATSSTAPRTADYSSMPHAQVVGALPSSHVGVAGNRGRGGGGGGRVPGPGRGGRGKPEAKDNPYLNAFARK